MPLKSARAQAVSRTRSVLFAVAAATLALGGCGAGLLAVDVYLHSRVQNVGAVNVWGYRGPTIGRKKEKEIRVVVLGGSTAFGYGVPWNESFPYSLDRMLNARATAGRSYRVVNLGAPSQGALGFRFDLADYAYLQYDAAILYEGYNDLGATDLPDAVPPRYAPNDLLWRRQSPVFRATGYFPVLPLVFREKAMVLLSGGNLDAAYRGHAEFKPGFVARASASVLRTAAAITERAGSALGGLTGGTQSAATLPAGLDTVTWRQYTDRVLAAVHFARDRSVNVIVVTQPYGSASHMVQQRALAQALQAAFGNDARVKYVNLGSSIDLKDRRVAYDGLHLVATGNERIASLLVEPVLALTAMP
jgi:hypothetical protein